MTLCERWRRFRPDTALVPPGEIEIVTISLHEASVGVFVPYLGNLSGSARQGLGPCRSPKHRSGRPSEHAALTHHVQLEAAGGRGQPACDRCRRAAGWPCASRIFGYRARYSRAQGADIGGDRFRAGPAARGDRRRSRQGSRLHFQERRPAKIHRANRCC